MKLKPYDIILCKNNKTLVQKIIRKVTNNVYTHSEIYVGDYHIIDDTLQGVKVRNFDSTLGQFDVYRYHRELTEKEKYDIEEFLQKALNTKYDIWEVFMQLFHLRSKDNKKYICISLLMEAFRYANVKIDEWQQGFTQVSNSEYFIKINNAITKS